MLQDISDWQNRPLDEIYPIMFIDAVHFSVREDHIIKKLNRQRSVFPSDTALMKSLYLSTLQTTKKWELPLRNWAKVYGEFSIMYEGRMPE